MTHGKVSRNVILEVLDVLKHVLNYIPLFRSLGLTTLSVFVLLNCEHHCVTVTFEHERQRLESGNPGYYIYITFLEITRSFQIFSVGSQLVRFHTAATHRQANIDGNDIYSVMMFLLANSNDNKYLYGLGLVQNVLFFINRQDCSLIKRNIIYFGCWTRNALRATSSVLT